MSIPPSPLGIPNWSDSRGRFAPAKTSPESNSGLRPTAARQWLDWAKEQHKVSILESLNPYAGFPFARLWSKGREAAADEIRTAAAALLALSDKPESAIPILLDARDRNRPATLDLQIDRALAAAFFKTHRWRESLEMADGLLDRHSTAVEPFYRKTQALIILGRHQEASKAARVRLERHAKDRHALIALAEVAVAGGDFETAERHWRQLVTLGVATPETLNNLAWIALFRNSALEQAIQDAVKANELTQYRSARLLCTLAALYAEIGRTRESHECLCKSLEARTTVQLDSKDWYVIGRVAEQYGLQESAAEAYRRVVPPEDVTKPQLVSPHALAQRRLEGLMTTPNVDSAGRRP